MITQKDREMSRGASFDALKAEWFTDPEFERAYQEADVALRLGKRVRELRCAQNLSQAKLARLASIPAAAVARVELGSPDIRLQTIARISQVLGMTLVLDLVPSSAA